LESSALVSQKVSQHLGLSKYEARVYVSLVMEGASEVRKLSIRCGVPRTKVYFTLKKLMEKGLVFELPETPRKFASTSPVEAFEQNLNQYRDETSDRVISLVKSNEVISLLEEAYEKSELTLKPRKEDVWIIQGRSEMLNKMGEMLSHAKKSVAVLTTEDGFIWFYKTFNKLFDTLVENGVNVNIGTPVNSHNGNLARELNYICKVKHVDVSSPLLYLCVDDQSLLLVHLGGKVEENLGVFCSSSTLCDLFSLLVPRLAK